MAKRNGNRIKVLALSLAQLAMKVRDASGELRMWQAVGAVAFAYADPAGNIIAGWEETRTDGVRLIVYRGAGTAADRNLPRRHVQRFCRDCEHPMRATGDDVFAWTCRCDRADAIER